MFKLHFSEVFWKKNGSSIHRRMRIPVCDNDHVYWICVDWIRDHSTYIASLHKSVRKIRDITHTRNFPQIVIFLGLFDIVIYCDIVYFTSLPGNNSLLTMFLHFSNWPSGSPLCQFVWKEGAQNNCHFTSGLDTPKWKFFQRGSPIFRHTRISKIKESTNFKADFTRRPRCGYPWHRVSTNWYVPAWGKKNRFPKNLVDFLLGKYQQFVEVLSEIDNQNLSRKTWNDWSHLVHHLIF